MCLKDKEIFRIFIASANKTSGDNQNASYLIKLPYTINSGQLFVESLAITNAGTLFNGLTGLKVVADTLPNHYQYSTDNESPNVIATIALQNDYFVSANGAGSEFHYTRNINADDAGYKVNRAKFDNEYLSIKLLDLNNDALPVAQITNYYMTLCIIDHKPNFEVL